VLKGAAVRLSSDGGAQGVLGTSLQPAALAAGRHDRPRAAPLRSAVQRPRLFGRAGQRALQDHGSGDVEQFAVVPQAPGDLAVVDKPLVVRAYSCGDRADSGPGRCSRDPPRGAAAPRRFDRSPIPNRTPTAAPCTAPGRWRAAPRRRGDPRCGAGRARRQARVRDRRAAVWASAASGGSPRRRLVPCARFSGPLVAIVTFALGHPRA
jgi:hypothetical protein